MKEFKQTSNILQYLNDTHIQEDIEEMVKVTKALASAFKRYRTFMDYLSKRYQNNEALKKINDVAMNMFSSYCEAHISKFPPMAQKEKGMKALRYHHLVKMMNAGIELLYLSR